jgi:phospholipid transport system transporter-binding protein
MWVLPEALTNDGSAQAALEDLWLKAPAQGDAALDASGLRRLDTSCVAVLLTLQRRLAQRSQTLSVTNAPEALSSLVQVYGVETLLGLVPAAA